MAPAGQLGGSCPYPHAMLPHLGAWDRRDVRAAGRRGGAGRLSDSAEKLFDSTNFLFDAKKILFGSKNYLFESTDFWLRCVA